MTWIGLLIFSLAVVMPFWNAVRLDDDAIYVYFLGRYYPSWTIAACSGAVLWYVFAMRVFFKYAWAEFRTEHTILMITMVTTATLGLALIIVSVPMRREVNDVYNELFTNCHFGPHTQRLYEYATVLQGLRNTTECATKDSIEQCVGYQVSQPYTGFLKDLERKYHCAGFCWDVETAGAASVAAAQIARPPGVKALSTRGPQPLVIQAPLTPLGPPHSGEDTAKPRVPSPVHREPLPTLRRDAQPLQRQTWGDSSERHIQVVAPPFSREDKTSEIKVSFPASALAAARGDAAGRSQGQSPREGAGALAALALPALPPLAAAGAQPRLEAVPVQAVTRLPPTVLSEETTAPAAAPRFKTLAGAIQNLAKAKHRPEARTGLQLLALERRIIPLARRQPLVAYKTRRRGDDQPGKENLAPLTLFSRANYNATCDGVSAGVLKFKGLHAANMMYYHGIIMLTVTACVGFLRVIGMCTRPRKEDPMPGIAPATRV